MQSIRAGKFKLPIIDWEKIYRKSFLYNSLAVVVCAYFVADFLVLALSPFLPATEAPRPRIAMSRDRKDITRYDQIFVRNLFNEKGLIPDADVGTDNGPPVRTSLPLTLLGVIVTNDPTKSVASIEDKGSNSVLAVREGEPLGTSATIQKIETERVIFLNNLSQRREFVELPKDQILATRRAAPSKPTGGGGIQQSGDHYTIDRKVVDDAISPEKMPTTLTEARCVPHQENGRPGGYQCFQIVPGSIYDKLGIKDNDVITQINGQNLDDPSKIFNFLNGLKNAKSIQISGSRGGRPFNKDYDIP
ncbi:MAG: type II secretion system protein N [Bdellovibrionota bacterium]